MPELHPSIPLLIAAALMPLLGMQARRTLSLVASLVALGLVITLPHDLRLTVSVLGQELTPLRADRLGTLFALAFGAWAAIASVFAWTEQGRATKAFSLLLPAGGIGVALAGDLFSFFLFWELLTVGSLFLIWQGGSRAALDAGFRYLILHLAGGVCLLTGILLHWQASGSLAFGAMTLAGPAAWLMALGMLTNAALPPLHAWLPDAYPRATIYGTVFLGAFTTKAAVYALARAFPGSEPLVWFGAAMALYGITFAVLENDMRRLLSYHIISQVGYMLCGIGLGTALALNGAGAHAVFNVFYKGLLMMTAGAIVYATGTGKLSALGGVARPLMLVLVFMMVGAFSISGMPLFNGFVSKGLIISAAAYEGRAALEMILLVASVGTFLSLGLKMPWLAFFGDKSPAENARVARPVPLSMHLAMGTAAAACVVTGVFPALTYALLPFEFSYSAYTPDHVVGNLQILAATALVFWLLRGKLGGKAAVTLDVDRLYRGPIRRAVAGAGTFLQGGGKWFAETITGTILAHGDAWRHLPRKAAMSLSGQSWVFLVSLIVLAVLLIAWA